MRTHWARRRLILEEHGLLEAPAWRREMFWRSFNQKRWHPLPELGGLASKLVSEGSLRSARWLQQLREAWQRVVPADYGQLSHVEGFSQGRLSVAVDGAATRYALSRQLEQALLLRQLNDCLGVKVVRGIKYRIVSWTHPTPRDTGDE